MSFYVAPSLTPFFKLILFFIDNRQYNERISQKYLKRKGIHSTVQVELMNNDSLHPADLKIMLGACSGLIDVFLHFYDVEAGCLFLTDARFLIKIRI